MSKGDPFNFNDIYAQMGADNLVRKPMAEMKKATTTSPAPVQPVVTAARPWAAADPHKPAAAKPQATTSTSAAFVDLDFLSTGSKPTAPAAPMAAPTRPAAAAAAAAVPSKPSPAASSGYTSQGFGLEDLFGGVAPAQSTPQAAAAQTAVGSHAGTHAAAVATSSDDPFAAFETVDGAMPVVTSAPHTNHVTPNASMGDLTSVCAETGPAAMPTPLQPYPPVYEAAAATSLQYSSTQYSAAPTSAAHARPLGAPPSGASPRPESDARAQGAQLRPSYPGVDGEERASYGSYHQPEHPQGAQPARPSPTYDDESAFHAAYQSTVSGEAAGAGAKPAPHRGIGIASFLTDLGKKAARAAQAGLHHLEKAMEDANKPVSAPARGWSHMHGSSRAGDEEELAAMRRQGGSSATWADSEDQGAAKALDIAVRIAEMPVEVRADALAQLRPDMRAMVEDVLREQLLLEEEDRGQGPRGGADGPATYQPLGQHHDMAGQGFAPPAPGPGPGRTSGPGAGYGASTGVAEPAPPRPQPAPPRPAPPAVADLLGADDDLSSIRHQQQHRPAPSDTGAGVKAGGRAPPAAAHYPHGVDDFFGASPQAPGTSATPATAAQATAGEHHFGDFFSADSAASSHTSTSGAAATPATAATASDHHQEFGDFLSPASSSPAPAPAPTAPTRAPQPQPQAQTAEPSDLHDFFSGGASAAAPTNTAATSSSGVAVPGGFGGPAGPRAPAIDLIADLHSEGVDTSAHQGLYKDVEGQEGEPEVRRQLRAARLAERNAKMRAALAEKLAMDEEEARRKEEQVQLKDQYKQAVEAWKNKHKGNIRGLLGSLQTVLWENSSWVPISVGDLLESNQVKKAYMKANLLVHPDKVRQRNGTPEQVAIADMVFDVLKDAWNGFKG